MKMIEILKHYEYENIIIIDDKVNLADDLTLEEIIDLDDKDIIKKNLHKYGNPDKKLKRSQLSNPDLDLFINSVFVDEENLIDLVKQLKELNEKLIKMPDFNADMVKEMKGNAIWIIDRFLLDKSQEHMKRVMESYIERMDNHHLDIIIIYTKDLHDIDNYEKMTKYIEEQAGEKFIDKIMFINALNKEKKFEVDYIEKTIQKIAKVIVFNTYNEDTLISIQEFRKNLYDLDYYRYLVDYDYIAEGKSAFQTFSDILFSTHKNLFYIKNTERIELIQKVNNITNKKYLKLNEYDIFKTKVISRMIKEFHQKLNPYDIEKGFLNTVDDLAIGDVFKVEQKYYMVISQECDLTIREDGKRKLDSIKVVEINISEKEKDQYDYIKACISSLVDRHFSLYKKVAEEKTSESYKKDIIEPVVSLISSINSNFTFKTDELMNKDKKKKDMSIIRFNGNFHEINLVEKNVRYFDSWILDGAIFFKNQDSGYILSVTKEEVLRKSSKLRVEYISDILSEHNEKSEHDYNLTLSKYLELKTGLKVEERNSEIIIPVQRVARLSRENVLKYIAFISNMETRNAVDDIVSILSS